MNYEEVLGDQGKSLASYEGEFPAEFYFYDEAEQEMKNFKVDKETWTDALVKFGGEDTPTFVKAKYMFKQGEK